MAFRLAKEVASEDRYPAGSPPPFPPAWRDNSVFPCDMPGRWAGGGGFRQPRKLGRILWRVVTDGGNQGLESLAQAWAVPGHTLGRILLVFATELFRAGATGATAPGKVKVLVIGRISADT